MSVEKISDATHEKALAEEDAKGRHALSTLLRKAYDFLKIPVSGIITVRLLCNWCSPQDLYSSWSKMSMWKGRWNRIQILSQQDSREPDYYVVLNAYPDESHFRKDKCIVFQMEPKMSEDKKSWGVWASPDPTQFLKVCTHAQEYNNVEWHLSKTYPELISSLEHPLEKDPSLDGVLSTILSGKYNSTGHVLRTDFVKFLEKKELRVHVYGTNRWNYKEYKGALPPGCKDAGLFPYKYTFNAENTDIKNYFTEKIVDGILSECLVFYYGCYNIREYIDERAYVHLSLLNFEQDYNTIKNAIQNKLWEERIPYIREAKRKILTQLQFFPRLESILLSTYASVSGAPKVPDQGPNEE